VTESAGTCPSQAQDLRLGSEMAARLVIMITVRRVYAGPAPGNTFASESFRVSVYPGPGYLGGLLTLPQTSRSQSETVCDVFTALGAYTYDPCRCCVSSWFGLASRLRPARGPRRPGLQDRARLGCFQCTGRVCGPGLGSRLGHIIVRSDSSPTRASRSHSALASAAVSVCVVVALRWDDPTTVSTTAQRVVDATVTVGQQP
jgi:hypothetical protein